MLDVIVVLLYSVLAVVVTLLLHKSPLFLLELILALIAMRLLYWGIDMAAQVMYFKVWGRRRVIEESLQILRQHGFPTSLPFEGLSYDLYLFQLSRDVELPEGVRKVAGELQIANQIAADVSGALRTRLVKEAQDAALTLYTRK